MNTVAILFVVALFRPMTATADIGLLLLESTRIGTARYTAAGHAAVYLSALCAESAARLRYWGPNESGAVISTYGGFGENRPCEWNVVPLRVFLYGTENPNAIPLYGNEDIRKNLRERRVGFTREMILDPTTDLSSGLRLMLAKVNATLQAKPKNRESLAEFVANWQLLSLARKANLAESTSRLAWSAEASRSVPNITKRKWRDCLFGGRCALSL